MKVFYNQITLEIQIREDKIVNTKIFTNGQIQMTGLKSKEDGLEILEIVRKIIYVFGKVEIRYVAVQNVTFNLSYFCLEETLYGEFEVLKAQGFCCSSRRNGMLFFGD